MPHCNGLTFKFPFNLSLSAVANGRDQLQEVLQRRKIPRIQLPDGGLLASAGDHSVEGPHHLLQVRYVVLLI